MNKPRITIAAPMHYVYYKGGAKIPSWFWKCEGGGISEFATTPQSAYIFWKMEMDRRSIPKKTRGSLIECYYRWFKKH